MLAHAYSFMLYGRQKLIADLERDLASCVQGYTKGSKQALADGLLAVANPTTFQAMLTELLENTDRMAGIAERSVWHPNGFAKIVLLSQPSYKLRLHMWDKNLNSSERDLGNVHNHRWDFSAILLAGSYRHQVFHLSADGEQFFGYKYCPSDDPGSYSLVPTGSHTLSCVFDAHLPQGSTFSLSSEVLHRVIPDASDSTVSLVLEGPRQPFIGDVFASNEVSETEVAEADSLSLDILRREIKAVLSL